MPFMTSVGRLFLGLIFYVIGLFWACVVVPPILLKVLLSGRDGINKFLKRNDHSKVLDYFLNDYNHDYIRTKSGMKFHYVHAGSEDNPLMLCIHGYPECWYSWRHVLKKFSSTYYVVAFDMRGYGESDKPKSIGEYHMDYLVRDAKEIIVALGYSEAVIVGHDWGGAVAWTIPRYFPEVVKSLILLNIPDPQCFTTFVRHYPSQFLKSWYAFFYQLPFLPEALASSYDYRFIGAAFNGRKMGIKNADNKLTKEEVDYYKSYAQSSLQYQINYYRAVNPIYSGMNLVAVTDRITQPTLLIWGNKDAALDWRLVDFCKMNVKRLDSKIIEGASHWVAQDEPEQVLSAMEKFLEDK